MLAGASAVAAAVSPLRHLSPDDVPTIEEFLQSHYKEMTPEMSNETKACVECHKLENAAIYQQWVDNFYVQYDGLIGLYHEKFAKPGLELYGMAKPLMRPGKFANHLDWVWFEIWHHKGR